MALSLQNGSSANVASTKNSEEVVLLSNQNQTSTGVTDSSSRIYHMKWDEILNFKREEGYLKLPEELMLAHVIHKELCGFNYWFQEESGRIFIPFTEDPGGNSYSTGVLEVNISDPSKLVETHYFHKDRFQGKFTRILNSINYFGVSEFKFVRAFRNEWLKNFGEIKFRYNIYNTIGGNLTINIKFFNNSDKKDKSVKSLISSKLASLFKEWSLLEKTQDDHCDCYALFTGGIFSGTLNDFIKSMEIDWFISQAKKHEAWRESDRYLRDKTKTEIKHRLLLMNPTRLDSEGSYYKSTFGKIRYSNTLSRYLTNEEKNLSKKMSNPFLDDPRAYLAQEFGNLSSEDRKGLTDKLLNGDMSCYTDSNGDSHFMSEYISWIQYIGSSKIKLLKGLKRRIFRFLNTDEKGTLKSTLTFNNVEGTNRVRKLNHLWEGLDRKESGEHPKRSLNLYILKDEKGPRKFRVAIEYLNDLQVFGPYKFSSVRHLSKEFEDDYEDYRKPWSSYVYLHREELAERCNYDIDKLKELLENFDDPIFQIGLKNERFFNEDGEDFRYNINQPIDGIILTDGHASLLDGPFEDRDSSKIGAAEKIAFIKKSISEVYIYNSREFYFIKNDTLTKVKDINFDYKWKFLASLEKLKKMNLLKY